MSEAPGKALSAGYSIRSLQYVRLFYENRAFCPAWINENGALSDSDSLIAAIKAAAQEGLEPSDYRLAAMEATLGAVRKDRQPKSPPGVSTRADLEILLTDSYLLYASHLAEGKIDSDSLQPRWSVGRRGPEYVAQLEQGLQSHTIKKSLQSLLPNHPAYIGLRDLLSSFEAMSRRGAWGTTSFGVLMKGGDRGGRIFSLKNSLRALGDLGSSGGSGDNSFDSTLVDAVRVFQRRHGLEPTGCVDSTTLVALNTSPERRISQIKANLERWRWMPHDLGRRHIRVNIPDFRVDAVEDDSVVMSMEVVLGLPEWQTPVFSAEMTQVLFNSHWMAPRDIVEKELINYMKADSNYLRSNMMSLWRVSGDSLEQVDPRTVDWPRMNGENIDFRLRQEGGPQNIMGQVKFLMPNKYNIYLHDTPYREDFAKNVRMFSHGCIRLEKPLDFAAYVLRGYPEWTKEKIDTLVARNTEQSVILKRPIAVHVLYFTVWRERDGSVQFREDYYGLDHRLESALLERSPSTRVAPRSRPKD